MSSLVLARVQSWLWFIVVAGGAALLLLAGCGRSEGPSSGGGGGAADATIKPAANGAPEQNGPPPASVRVGEAAIETLTQRWNVVGQLREMRRAVVAAEVTGKVLDLPVDEGDTVRGGETVLARIDGIWARLALETAEANIKSIQARLDQARRDLGYLEDLSKAGSANTKEVEDARADMTAFVADLDAAVVQRNEHRERVARLEVKAPFDGIVVAKMTEVGDWVNQGTAVVEVISEGQIDAIINVPEQFISAVSPGATLEVVIDALALETSGHVVAINPSGSKAARTYPVKVRLDDRDGQLKPGMTVIGRVPTSQTKPTLTVPRDAVVRGDNGAAVWVAIGEPGKPSAMKLPVRVLFGHGERYAVEPVAGTGPTLSPGMKVVIEGAERLFPTQPLMWNGMEETQKPPESPKPQETQEPSGQKA